MIALHVQLILQTATLAIAHGEAPKFLQRFTNISDTCIGKEGSCGSEGKMSPTPCCDGLQCAQNFEKGGGLLCTAQTDTALEERGATPTPAPTRDFQRVRPHEKFKIIACADIDASDDDARMLSIHSSGLYSAAWFTPSKAYKNYVTDFHVTGCSNDENCVAADKVFIYAGNDLILYPGNERGMHNASNWPWTIFGGKPDKVINWKSDSTPPFGAPTDNLGGPTWYLQPIDGVSNLIVYEQKIFIQNVATNWPDAMSGDKHPLDGKKIFLSNTTEDKYLDASIMSEYCDNLEQNCCAIVRDAPQCVLFRKIE